MPRLRPRPPASGAVLAHYATAARSVPAWGRLLSSPQPVATAIGVGRLVLGGAFLVAPVASTRLLGLDTATAKRVGYLARMAAARDIGLGVGTLTAAGPAGAAPWLLAGAAADAVDAVVIAGAIRTGSARGLPAWGVVVGAVGVAGLGFGAAIGLRRSSR
jgi:hypothetical protein